MKVIEDIRQGMDIYKQEIQRSHYFVAEDFIRLLEPIFIRHGYRTNMPEQPKNILVLHDAGVGDFINLSPCLRAIRQHYPEAHIVLVIFPRALALAEACPYVDEVITNSRQCNWNDFMSLYEWNQSFVEKLLPYHFDLAFIFPHYGSGVMLAYLSGAKQRVAYDISRVQKSSFWAGIIPYETMVPFINKPVTYQRKNVHAPERYMGVLEAYWGEKVSKRSLEVWCFPADIEKADMVLADWLTEGYPFYAVIMGGEALCNHWPPEKYAQLVCMLQADYPAMCFVLLGGGSQDEQEVRRFLNAYRELGGEEKRIKNLVGQLTYRESAAVMERAEAYIGNDTGNMHLAAALEKPVLMPCCYPAEYSIGPDDTPTVFSPWKVPAVFIQPAYALADCRPKRSEHGCCHLMEVHCIDQIDVSAMRKGFELLREQCLKESDSTLYVNQEQLL